MKNSREVWNFATVDLRPGIVGTTHLRLGVIAVPSQRLKLKGYYLSYETIAKAFEILKRPGLFSQDEYQRLTFEEPSARLAAWAGKSSSGLEFFNALIAPQHHPLIYTMRGTRFAEDGSKLMELLGERYVDGALAMNLVPHLLDNGGSKLAPNRVDVDGSAVAA